MLKKAFPHTIPVFLGYLAIGIAFGLLLKNAGYPWFLAPIMSIIVFAGALQYLAVGLLVNNATLAEIALVSLLMNARHMGFRFWKNTKDLKALSPTSCSPLPTRPMPW